MRVGVCDFNQDRLKSARLGRGLTQTALAELIGRSTASLSKWESGAQKPETEAVQALSRELGFPPDWFTRTPMPDAAASPAFFRSMAGATKATRERLSGQLAWLHEISMLLQEEVELPAVNVPQSNKHFLQLGDNDIEAMAEQVRAAWGLGEGPVAHVLRAMESAGIVCARISAGDRKLDGVSIWIAERPYVLITDDKDNPYRNRFDAAHELAHLVLHRHVTQDEFKLHLKQIEEQANRFAGAFLLPAKNFAATVHLRRFDLDSLALLKQRWKTSVAAMIVRSKQLDIISAERATRLWKSYSARGWRWGEPGDDSAVFEQQTLLPDSIKLLLQEGICSKEGLEEWLGFARADIERLCGLEEGYLCPEPAPPAVTVRHPPYLRIIK